MIAYLINQYPKVSHSFIRREIAGIEASGLQVARFSIRSCEGELVDEADRLELKQTRIILGIGVLGLLLHLFRAAITRPLPFLKALKLTLELSFGSERGLLHHLAYLSEACVLLHWVSALNITHVHAHFGTNSTTVAMLCQALGGPTYSFTVHGPEEFDKVNAISLPKKIEHAIFVIAISSFGRSQLYRWCSKREWSKIHVIHCGVDDNFLNQYPIPIPPEMRLVCVGRLCEQKGQLLLLDAIKLLSADGLKFKVVFVGDGPLRPEIEKLIIQHQLQEYVEITGWATTAEVCQQILASRAMILPSFAEGLPVVIMEALALNRPVISTYVAGIPELIEPGICGWLVPPSSVPELVTALRAVLETPIEVLERMGRIGNERVAQDYNSAIETEKLVNLFQTYIEKRSSQKVDKVLLS